MHNIMTCRKQRPSQGKPKYVIRKPQIGGTYLTYPDSNIAIIYNHDDPKLKYDQQITKGEILEVTGGIFAEIFYGIRYSNKLPRYETIRDEYLLEIRENTRMEDARQLTMEFSPL